MPPFPSSLRHISGLLLLCISPTLALGFSTPETPPNGLATSDRTGIHAAYVAAQHTVHRKEDGRLTARNPGQRWYTEFDGKGFTVNPDHGEWVWGLEMTAYDGRPLPSVSTTMTHSGGNVIYRHDANLTEWFINDTRGLEQGWTIQSRDAGDSPPSESLNLTLTLRGSLKPSISADSCSVSFHTESGATALSYGGLKAWDADGNNLTVRFEDAGENAIRVAVDEQKARYPITIDPIAQQAFLKAGNTAPDSFFGTSVAVSGDTVVVGAPGETSSTTGVNSTPDGSAPDSGAAYVFVRSGGAWSQQAYLKASNTGEYDSFGISVGISGDTVVVGAKSESSSSIGVDQTPDENAAASGAAYVFVRSGGTWSQQAYLKASNTEAGDEFGKSVAVSGNTVIVGALWENSSTTGVNSVPDNSSYAVGAAYVFVQSQGTWSQQAYLKASNAGASDFFGSSVAVDGDNVVIGAFGESSSIGGVNSAPDESAAFAGAAYVFVRSGTTWSQQAYLKSPNPWKDDYFGHSVAMSGNTLVTGAPYQFGGRGAAHVFIRSGAVWSYDNEISGWESEANDHFGDSVAVGGETVIVGAPLEDSNSAGVNSGYNEGSNASGAAYVFRRNNGAWIQQAFLKAFNTGAGDYFGKSVAMSGNTVIIGAPNEDSSSKGVNNPPNDDASSSGASYLFNLADDAVAPEIRVVQALSYTAIAIGTTRTFGPQVAGSTYDETFTIYNTGSLDLTLTGTPPVALAGSGDFTVILQPLGTISSSAGSNFTVRFTPTGSGLKTASLTIPTNDSDENPFFIQLTGTALSFTIDSDRDGLSDASELNMAALGFDWQFNQDALVDTYFNNANAAGLYTPSQLQALKPSTPLIARDPTTGRFKLTMDWKRSTNLTDFLDFPAPPSSKVSITPLGDIQFEFPSDEKAAFFRVEEE